MWKDIHWVSMYSNVYDVGLWRTSRFCFYAFSFLNPPSSDVPHRHSHTDLAFPLCSATVVLLGPRSLHSLSFPKCAVCKFVLLWVSFLFGSSAPQNTLNGFSEKQNTETRRYKGNKAEKEMIHRGFMIGLIQKHATQIHKEINQIKSESSDHGQYYQSDIKLWKSQLWCWIYGTFSLISQVRHDCISYIKIKSVKVSQSK